MKILIVIILGICFFVLAFAFAYWEEISKFFKYANKRMEHPEEIV